MRTMRHTASSPYQLYCQQAAKEVGADIGSFGVLSRLRRFIFPLALTAQAATLLACAFIMTALHWKSPPGVATGRVLSRAPVLVPVKEGHASGTGFRALGAARPPCRPQGLATALGAHVRVYRVSDYTCSEQILRSATWTASILPLK